MGVRRGGAPGLDAGLREDAAAVRAEAPDAELRGHVERACRDDAWLYLRLVGVWVGCDTDADPPEQWRFLVSGAPAPGGALAVGPDEVVRAEHCPRGSGSCEPATGVLEFDTVDEAGASGRVEVSSTSGVAEGPFEAVRCPTVCPP